MVSLFDHSHRKIKGFNGYWTLQALGRMGKIEQALYTLRNCWGGMIALGATTFWETFPQAPEYISGDIPWIPRTGAAAAAAATGAAKVSTPTHVPWSWSGITSLCHPWAAGPAYWMTQNLLGVKQSAPGFKSFTIAPMLTHSLMHVKGDVPTTHGNFHVEFNLHTHRAIVVVPGSTDARGSDGASASLNKATDGDAGAVHGTIAIPLLSGTMLETVAINGVQLKVRSSSLGVSTSESATTTFYWIEESISSGSYELEWTVKAIKEAALLLAPAASSTSRAPTSNPPFPAPAYKGTFVKRDDITKGNWRTAGYGQIGHHLFHFCPGQGTECAVGQETQTVQVGCDAGHTIEKVLFADFGTPSGDCSSGGGSFRHDPACSTQNLSSIVAAQCVGHSNCTIECSDYQSLQQQGCSVRGSNAPARNFTLPVACHVTKTVKVHVQCNGSSSCSESSLPPFVASISNGYNRGQLGAFGPPSPAADDRALQFPTSTPFENAGVGAVRNIGKLSDVVIIAVDIMVHPAAATKQYQLAAYFVDWEGQGRSQTVSVLDATDSRFNIVAPTQVLEDFEGGAYLIWKLAGSVRLRISHIGGNPGGQDAPVSGLFFDP